MHAAGPSTRGHRIQQPQRAQCVIGNIKPDASNADLVSLLGSRFGPVMNVSRPPYSRFGVIEFEDEVFARSMVDGSAGVAFKGQELKSRVSTSMTNANHAFNGETLVSSRGQFVPPNIALLVDIVRSLGGDKKPVYRSLCCDALIVSGMVNREERRNTIWNAARAGHVELRGDGHTWISLPGADICENDTGPNITLARDMVRRQIRHEPTAASIEARFIVEGGTGASPRIESFQEMDKPDELWHALRAANTLGYYKALKALGVATAKDFQDLGVDDLMSCQLYDLKVREAILIAMRHFQATKKSSTMRAALDSLHLSDLYASSFKAYGVDSIEDLNNLQDTDWTLLEVHPLHKTKILAFLKENNF